MTKYLDKNVSKEKVFREPFIISFFLKEETICCWERKHVILRLELLFILNAKESISIGIEKKTILKVLKLAADLKVNFAARCTCTRHLIDVQQHVHRDFDYDGPIGNRPDKRTHYVICQKSVFPISMIRKLRKFKGKPPVDNM